ncbi:ferredoxin [Streptomyces candidus]|uniref:Ferredoxin n=1 Tax=Streptomyces candidus TaxID=67283 RepID=A0A7X0HJW4_9ACTN|nr:ferredoxin [Streptomyces candidus]GHH44608.1 hypothetical protein GCM10018773_32490 [Streptomyces candidus]
MARDDLAGTHDGAQPGPRADLAQSDVPAQPGPHAGLAQSDVPAQLDVRADRTRCVGSGMCALTAPEVFDQDEEEGLVVLLRTRLPRRSPHADAAREAEGLCPAEAIRVG